MNCKMYLENKKTEFKRVTHANASEALFVTRLLNAKDPDAFEQILTDTEDKIRLRIVSSDLTVTDAKLLDTLHTVQGLYYDFDRMHA